MIKLKSIWIFFFVSIISCNTIAETLVSTDEVIAPLPTIPKDVFYTVRPDLRRCVFPICGGWFVNPVNQRRMRCLDGTRKQECYVSREKVNIPGLSDKQFAELSQAMSESGALLQANINNSVDYGVLIINKAWIAATAQTPEGVFVNVKNNGIVCITSPCPSFDAHILNRRIVKTLASYDLSLVGATDEQLLRANKEVNSDEGLPIAGRFVEVTGLGGIAQGIVASQFYLQVIGASPKQCRPTGCSGQICSDMDIVTTCEYRPEYACYRNAVCTRQSNGDCDWAMDDELRRCLDNATFDAFLQGNSTLQNPLQ